MKDSYRCHVEYGDIIVGQEVIPHMDVAAQVAVESRLDAEVLSRRAEKLTQKLARRFLMK